MEEIPSTQLLEKTKRLRQACFKASYKKRHQRAYTNGNSSNVFSKGNANTHYDRYIECQQAHTIDSDISIMTYAMLKSTLIPTSDNISRSSLLSKTTRRWYATKFILICAICLALAVKHAMMVCTFAYGTRLLSTHHRHLTMAKCKILPYRDNLIFNLLFPCSWKVLYLVRNYSLFTILWQLDVVVYVYIEYMYIL